MSLKPFQNIHFNCLCSNSKLSAGTFSEVWKRSWQNRMDVAVKTLKPEAFLQVKPFYNFLIEKLNTQLIIVCREWRS